MVFQEDRSITEDKSEIENQSKFEQKHVAGVNPTTSLEVRYLGQSEEPIPSRGQQTSQSIEISAHNVQFMKNLEATKKMLNDMTQIEGSQILSLKYMSEAESSSISFDNNKTLTPNGINIDNNFLEDDQNYMNFMNKKQKIIENMKSLCKIKYCNHNDTEKQIRVINSVVSALDEEDKRYRS